MLKFIFIIIGLVFEAISGILLTLIVCNSKNLIESMTVTYNGDIRVPGKIFTKDKRLATWGLIFLILGIMLHMSSAILEMVN